MNLLPLLVPTNLPMNFKKRSYFSCLTFFIILLVAPLTLAKAVETTTDPAVTSGVAAAEQNPGAEDTAQKQDSHHADGGHHDPFADISLMLALIILAAMVGRWGANAVNQPAVLGELLIGVLLGNLLYWLGGSLSFIVMHLSSAGELYDIVWETGISVAEAARQVFTPEQLAPGAVGERLVEIMTGPQGPKYTVMVISIWIFSNLGVILLLFMVGLESRVEEMVKVGRNAIVVALLGIVVPFALGYGVSNLLLADHPVTVHLFIGATLVATSVGITARVFKDLNALHSGEAKLILGAAVIDDVLGLIVLAVVVGIVTTGVFQVAEVVKITVLSALFFAALIFVGTRYMPRLTDFFGQMERQRLTLLFPLILAFVVAWAANLIGLATIIGAFAAGLILNEEHFAGQAESGESPMTILAPLEALFAPIFFVLMGMQVNLLSFLDLTTLWLALGFVAAAVLGKLACGLGAGGGLDKLSVGIGMVPRGEVGLIFASIGKGLGVVTDAVFSAVVVMVIVTTLMTPLGLKWSLARCKATA